MKKFNVKKIITCSSLGVGDSYNNLAMIGKIFLFFIKK